MSSLSSASSHHSQTGTVSADGTGMDVVHDNGEDGTEGMDDGDDGADDDLTDQFEFEELSEPCKAALAAANLRPDTSDPDPIVRNAFLDSRWVGGYIDGIVESQPEGAFDPQPFDRSVVTHTLLNSFFQPL